MPKALTNDEFLQKLKDNDIKYIPLEEYSGTHTRIRWACYNNREHIFEACPCDIYSGKDMCPYCKHRKVFVGETDMWTTNPEMAEMLYDHEDGYKYLATSSQRADWICPRCGSFIENKIINNVRMFGLSCENCCDGMSFGEKFVYELLSQLDCDFIYDKPTKWSNNKRYDFRIPSIDTIVETHGIQHYERSFAGLNRNARTVDEEHCNDDYKKNLAIHNGIKHYIELDCRYSNIDYIKESIIASELSELFNLSLIDWKECLSATLTSNVVLCANLWNSGMKNTIEISNCTGIHVSSVISYLQRAKKIGLCDYVKHYKKNRSRYKSVLCVETQKIYECISCVKDDGYDNTQVSKCCNGKQKTAYGLHWQFI